VAELLFFTGPMDCGKSTLALQFDHNQAASGRRGRRFTSHDRAGESTISSRLGLIRPAIEVTPAFDFWVYLVGELTAGERVDYLICDETQFYTSDQIDQLAQIVDELGVDVFAVGILTDFRTRLFPGSQRLVELCDRVEILHVRPLCWCGARGTHNARTVAGAMITEGAQIVVDNVPADDLGPGEIAYEVLCRKHHRRQLTRAAARAGQDEPLPFERSESEPEDVENEKVDVRRNS
jgi:thymidine kinase